MCRAVYKKILSKVSSWLLVNHTDADDVVETDTPSFSGADVNNVAELLQVTYLVELAALTRSYANFILPIRDRVTAVRAADERAHAAQDAEQDNGPRKRRKTNPRQRGAMRINSASASVPAPSEYLPRSQPLNATDLKTVWEDAAGRKSVAQLYVHLAQRLKHFEKRTFTIVPRPRFTPICMFVDKACFKSSKCYDAMAKLDLGCFGWKDVRPSDYAFHTDGYRVACTRMYTSDTWEDGQNRKRTFLDAAG